MISALQPAFCFGMNGPVRPELARPLPAAGKRIDRHRHEHRDPVVHVGEFCRLLLGRIAGDDHEGEEGEGEKSDDFHGSLSPHHYVERGGAVSTRVSETGRLIFAMRGIVPFVAGVALVSIACSARAPQPAPAPAPAVARAACPPPVEAPPRDWVTVADQTGDYELRLPPSLQRVPPGKNFFIHGGVAWEDAHTRVTLSFGHFAEYSFQDEPGERCRVTVGESGVFVIVGENSVIAWYDLQSGRHEPVVSASSDSVKVETLAGIALSLVRFKGPERRP